jgi:hypothetical protein
MAQLTWARRELQTNFHRLEQLRQRPEMMAVVQSILDIA